MQFQLHRTQWWPSQTVLDWQFRQLRELVTHALAQVPYYRDHLRRAMIFTLAGLTPESFLRWPVLRKADLMTYSGQMLARQIPREHGAIIWNSTSGSTATPVKVAFTDMAVWLQAALVLRSQLWHGLDFSAKFAAIKSGVAAGSYADWGPATRDAIATGPSVVCFVSEPANVQLDWLLHQAPAYLLCYGTILHALLDASRAAGIRPHSLRAVFSFGETVSEDLRERLRAEWRVPMIDAYSAGEFGTIAIDCPVQPHFHVQSESVYLEVLRDDGTPATAGETGRVVITDLHNFAMPLIRYEIGDYARVGTLCSCGRGLPVLTRVLGRVRNMACDPSGRRFWPSFPARLWTAVPAVRQLQLVQVDAGRINVRYIGERDLLATEITQLTKSLTTSLRYPFEFAFVRVQQIERGPTGKFEDFVSLIAPP